MFAKEMQFTISQLSLKCIGRYLIQALTDTNCVFKSDGIA
jgi:hypothetical protein